MTVFTACGLSHAAPSVPTQNLLVFGDSLSAGYGIRPQDAWPALLGERLQKQGSDYKVVNVSISGETTAGGRARLAQALEQHRPTLMVLALGANDGLRGLAVTQMKDNLRAMIEMARRKGAKTLLVGMRLPPNYGPYADQFSRAFADVSKESGVPALPFLLESIAAEPRWFQTDGLHPTREAQPKVLDTVWHALQPLLARSSRQ